MRPGQVCGEVPCMFAPSRRRVCPVLSEHIVLFERRCAPRYPNKAPLCSEQRYARGAYSIYLHFRISCPQYTGVNFSLMAQSVRRGIGS